MSSRRRPDFLLVIFDALRASDYPGGSNPVDGMPFTNRVLTESITFPRAASVTPWTIPAHASVFTGLYPWEHGCHAKHSLVLDRSVPRLPEALATGGYKSLMLSANTLICPRFGLVDGFDDAGWGGWWESYVRRARTDVPPGTPRDSQREARLLDRFRDGALGKIVINMTESTYRYPFVFDVVDTVHQRIRYSGEPRDISTAPWIEPSLEEWLARRSPEEPVFCVVNICDTHEPYFFPPGPRDSFREWWRKARVRQDFVRCIAGSWRPTPEELVVLRDLYRWTVRNLDRRLERLVGAFQRAGRWDDTVLIATSDHGQAFGEHGELFHLNGVIDPILRIPILYRPAGGAKQPRRAEGWASLVDIAPTVLRDAGLKGLNTPSAVPLQDLAEHARPGPVFAVSDGLVWNHLKRVVPEGRKAEFDRLRVVAYSGNLKLIVEAPDGRRRAFDLAQDPGENVDCFATESTALEPIVFDALAISRRMTERPAEAMSPEIEERLRGWGYV